MAEAPTVESSVAARIGRSPGRRRLAWLALLGLAAVAAVLVARRPSGPPRQYNVNDQDLDALTLDDTYLVNAWGDSMSAQLGRLVVPERRSIAGSNHIELAFVRIPTTAAQPLPPIVVLDGGPGTSAIDIGLGGYFYLYQSLRRYADVILLDQRGTGRSIPSLRCDGRLGLPTDATADVEGTLTQYLGKRVAECLAGLREHGVDLAGYQSEENADDIDALRLALNYRTVTLMGHSYGTELAMIFARRHPEALERLILVGTVSPDFSLKLPSEVDAQFQGLGALARSDHSLGGEVPDLAALMRSVHRRFRDHPARVDVPLMDAIDQNEPAPLRAIFRVLAVFKPTWKMTMRDLHLELMMQDRIGGDAWFGDFPRLYSDLANGHYREVGNRLRNFRRQAMPNALLFTTNCATSSDEERRAAAAADTGAIFSATALSFGRSPEFCSTLGIQALDPSFRAPIRSDRPTLFIAGTLDGRTPIRQVPEYERRFPNHQEIIVENGGHNGLMDEAISDGIIAFLRDRPVPVPRETRSVAFEPLHGYPASLEDTLHGAVLQGGGAAAVAAYDVILANGGIASGRYEGSLRPLTALGMRLLGEDRARDAQVILARAVEAFPDESTAYSMLARATVLLGDSAAARLDYQRAVALDFLNGSAQVGLRRMEGQE